VPIAIGTDTAGSLRVPAALCGVVGFRPTTGRYPSAGIVPLTPTRDTAGPIARNVADVALIDGVVTGDDEPLQTVDLRGLRLGVPRTFFYDGLEAEVSAVVETELARLTSLGVELIEVDLPGIEGFGLRCRPIIDREISVHLRRYLVDSGANVTLEEIVRRGAGADVRRLVDAPFMLEGGGVTDEAYRYALEHERPALQATFARCFSTHRLDAIVQPTTPCIARPIGNVESGAAAAPYGRNTIPSSIAGIPCLSLPAALGPGGLPVAIEIQATAHGDRRLLAIGAAYERSHDAFPAPPGTPA
jgi:mandelamide amidase